MSQDLFRLEINRTPIYNEGNIKYQLNAVCTVTRSTDPDAIRLDQNVFVKLVEGSSFARVANASDLGLLESSVTSALNKGHSEYRDSVATFQFDDVDTAVASIPVLRDRVNSSVYNYIKYVKRFERVDEYPNVYSLPLPSQDQEARDEYILNYTDSRQARQEAEDAVNSTQTSLDAIEYKEEFISDLKNKVCSLETAVNSEYSVVASANTAAAASPTLVAQLNSYFTYDDETSLYSITPTNLTNIRTTANSIYELFSQHLPTATSALSAAVSALNLECIKLGGYLTSYKNQTDGLKDQLHELSSEVADAARAESSALADLSEYCPDVDPDSL